MIVIDTNNMIQIGIVVRELEPIAQAWSKILGAPVRYGETPVQSVSRASYRGEPCHGLIRQAHITSGNVDIELMCPMGPEPSCWSDFLKAHGEGIHHIGFRSDDSRSDLQCFEELGCIQRQFGYFPRSDGWGAYMIVDSREQLKATVDLIQAYIEPPTEFSR